MGEVSSFLLCSLTFFPSQDNELRLLCQEVLDLLKGWVGLEEFSNAYADVQRTISKTRIEGKHKRALQVRSLGSRLTSSSAESFGMPTELPWIFGRDS